MSFCLYVHSIEPYLKLASKIHFFRLIVFCGPNVKIRKTNCFFFFFSKFLFEPRYKGEIFVAEIWHTKKNPPPRGRGVIA